MTLHHQNPAEAQGLFHKFNVTRTDGSDKPGGKHYGCEYFVLDVDHDPHAKAALQAYALACAATHPQLSADLIVRHGVQPQAQGAVLHVGACITDGTLYISVMHCEENQRITIVANAQMDAASIQMHDGIAQMTPAHPQVSEPALCTNCEAYGKCMKRQAMCLANGQASEPTTPEAL